MKQYFSLIAPTLLLFLGVTCNNSQNLGPDDSGSVLKKEKADTPASPSDDSKKGSISFKVNGMLVQTSVWNVSSGSQMNGICLLNITSNMHEDTRNININVNGCSPGSYPFSHGSGTVSKRGIAYGSYRPDYMKDRMNAFHFESGELVILSNTGNEKMLNATFSGKVKNEKGEELEITEGRVINAGIKPAVPKGALN